MAALGLQSTSAWLLFATAAKACGDKNNGVIDRTCVLEQAVAQKDWTGGGTHVPTTPGHEVPPECGMLMVVKGDGFTRLWPEIGGEDDDQDGFHCPKDGVTKVPANAGMGVVEPGAKI